MVKVFVDRARCEGTGYCVQVRDDVFDLDESGHAVLVVEQGDQRLDEARADLRDAENLCPTGAISVVE